VIQIKTGHTEDDSFGSPAVFSKDPLLSAPSSQKVWPYREWSMAILLVCT